MTTKKHDPRGEQAETERRAFPQELDELLDKPIAHPATATRMMDGRLVPLVFATVTDAAGTPRGGVRVELVDDAGEPLDATRTSPGGLAVLRFPPRRAAESQPGTHAHARAQGREQGDGKGHEQGGGKGHDQGGGHGHDHGGGDTDTLPEVRGTVRLADGSSQGVSDEVVVPAGRAHVVKSYVVEQSPEEGPVVAGDDQLSRMPVDFSPAVCAELSGGRTGGLLPATGLPSRDDPLIPVGQRQIAGRRTALLRRVDVIRRTPDNRRWLVQLRQEWVLLGYTLGELASATPLDPGAVLQHADQVIDQVSTAVRESTDTVRSTLNRTMADVLSSVGMVDAVVNATSSTSGGAVGGFLGIPGVLGIGGAGGWLDTSATVDTSVNTSLLVNHSLQQVSTLVNQAVAQAQAVARGAQTTAANVVNHLSPLINRVTNALHWRVYENYAVCTHVDGVLAIDEYAIADANAFRFTEASARALRAFLEPALLDRTLAANFANLAVAAETPGIGTAHIEIRYSGMGNPGTAVVSLGGTSTTITLPAGDQQTARGTLTFPTPVLPGAHLQGTVTFAPGPPVTILGMSIPSMLRVQRFAIWVDNALTAAPDQVNDNPANVQNIDIRTEGASAIASGDALLQHLNANRAYYLDVIAAAALRFPALRVDAARDNGPLATIDPRVWRLPVVGFEGNKVLVARPLATGENPSHRDLLERDPGSGTLVQLLAPGSYGEVLQGVTGLADAVTNLHPALKQVAPSQFVDFPEQPVLPPAPLDGLGSTPAGGTAGTVGGVTGTVGGVAGTVTGGG